MKFRFLGLIHLGLVVGVSLCLGAMDRAYLKGRLEEETTRLLLDEKIQALASDRHRVQLVMGRLMERFGMEERLAIAAVMMEQLPDGSAALVAEQAMFYSPTDAAALIELLSMKSDEEAMESVLSMLPKNNVHTVRLRDHGKKPDWESVVLPSVEGRRRGGGGPFYYPNR